MNTSYITDEMLQNIITEDGASYIQVHPTFLYESVWNICVLAFILFYTKHKKYDGQLFLIYLLGYGTGRVWIEGLRTDQLLFFGTGIAVSQVLSGLLAIFALCILVYKYIKYKKNRPS